MGKLGKGGPSLVVLKHTHAAGGKNYYLAKSTLYKRKFEYVALMKLEKGVNKTKPKKGCNKTSHGRGRPESSYWVE